MKKKIKIIILVIIVLLIILSTVYIILNNNKTEKTIQKNVYISIECEKNNINVSDTTSCILKGHSKDEISMFEGKLENNTNIEILNIKKDSKWVIGTDDFNIQFIGNEMKGDFDIIAFDVKGIKKGEGIISVRKLKNELSFTSKKMKTYKLDNISFKINIK